MIQTPRLLLSLGALLAAPPAARFTPPDTTVTAANQRMVVAFFGLPDDFVASQGLEYVRDDFRAFTERARPGLVQLSVDAHVVYAQAVHVRTPGRVIDIPLGTDLPIGLFLWAPQGPAYVCRGVRRDVDILNVVHEWIDPATANPKGQLALCERMEM